MSLLKRISRGTLGGLTVAVILIVGIGTTLVLRTGPSFGSDCVSEAPLFAYTVEAPPLRQTDVAVLMEGNQVRVTKDHLSQDPSFSPNGGRIVFSTGRDGDFNPELGFERLALFTASSTGGDEQRLTDGPFDSEPDWSPDGSKVVFVRSHYGGREGRPQSCDS
jgi:WD40-like Beta Propeller Repeat